MSFIKGKIALSIFRFAEKLPENYAELFTKYTFSNLDSVKDEPCAGWLAGADHVSLINNPDAMHYGGHIYLTLRTAQRKIPASLLQMICRREEAVYKRANHTDFVPAKVRKEIRLDAIEKNTMKMPPNITDTEFIIDIQLGVIFLGSTSQSQIQNFVALFHKTLKIEPIQITTADILQRYFNIRETDLPSLNFTDNSVQDETLAGRDFLTGLYFKSCTLAKSEILVEGPLTFALSAEAKGSAEATIKKGTPTRSAEAKAALNVGKKLKKAKITIVRGEEIWSFNFDADKFVFSNLSLPDSEEMNEANIFLDNVTNLMRLLCTMQDKCNLFFKEIRDNQHVLESEIRTWISDMEAF